MMTLLAVYLYFLVLGVALWNIGLCLEMVIEGSGLPGRVKPVVLAIIGLIGLIVVVNRFTPIF